MILKLNCEKIFGFSLFQTRRIEKGIAEVSSTQRQSPQLRPPPQSEQQQQTIPELRPIQLKRLLSKTNSIHGEETAASSFIDNHKERRRQNRAANIASGTLDSTETDSDDSALGMIKNNQKKIRILIKF